MPRWQRARIDRLELSDEFAGKGSLIVISFRPVPLLPVRMQWEAYIAEFHWNDFFCDEQRKGPFQYFRHCHRVADAVRDGVTGSLVSDEVEYEAPFGVLGSLVVKPQIAALFAYRQKMLPGLLLEP